MTPEFDLIVIGEGFAGLTCASEAAKLDLRVATFEREFFGGLVVNVNELERFEEAGGLSGMDHAGMLAAQNKKAGVKSFRSEVTQIRPLDNGFEVSSDSGVHLSRFVVIATGARLKKLGVPGEIEFEGRGVSHCADCDAPMFTDAEVVVAGGNDWAVQDALLLAKECSKVHIVHPGNVLNACTEYRERLSELSNIQLCPNSSIVEVLGDDTGMTGVKIIDEKGQVSVINAAGLFAIIGLEPNETIAPSQVNRDASGYLKVDANLETDVIGLWAIGQIRSGFDGWLNDAVSDAKKVAALIKLRTE